MSGFCYEVFLKSKCMYIHIRLCSQWSYWRATDICLSWCKPSYHFENAEVSNPDYKACRQIGAWWTIKREKYNYQTFKLTSDYTYGVQTNT